MKREIALIVSAGILSISFASGGYAQAATSVQLNNIQSQVKAELDPFLSSTSLSSDVTTSIEAFFIERASAAANAETSGRSQSLSDAQIVAMVTSARANVDSSIDSTFDASTAALVREIAQNYVAYCQIDLVFQPQFNGQNVPLTGSQMRQLASTMYSCNSVTVNANATQMRTTVNSTTGLSALDTMLVGQAAAFLSSSQISILQTNLRAITKAISSSSIFSY
jgi:hypothetical protein